MFNPQHPMFNPLFVVLMSVILTHGDKNINSEKSLIGPNVCSFKTEVVISKRKPTEIVEVVCGKPPCYIQLVYRDLKKNVTIYKCCDGYKETENGTCKPHCENKCAHGMCIGPNKCQCDFGYNGPICAEARSAYVQPGIQHVELILIGVIIILSSLILYGVYFIYRKPFQKRQNVEKLPNKSIEEDSYQWDNPLYFHNKTQPGEVIKAETSNENKYSSVDMKTSGDLHTKEDHRASRGSGSQYLTPLTNITNENNCFNSYEEVLPPSVYENILENNTYEDQPAENIYSTIT